MEMKNKYILNQFSFTVNISNNLNFKKNNLKYKKLYCSV